LKKETQVGPEGKYEHIVAQLTRDLDADHVVLVVINGRHGTGCSTGHREGLAVRGVEILPGLLRNVASQLDGGAGPDGVGVWDRGDEPS
jgi:hypothetical protein